MTERDLFIKSAEKYLGCNETDGTHKQIIDLYNSNKPLPRGYAVKYTDAWCATFVSAVTIETGNTDIIPVECSCQKMIEGFQKIGSWIEEDHVIPEPGYIIFYDWQDTGTGDCKGSSDHVGIVYYVDGDYIYVIEGNYNNSVAIRKIKIDSKSIRGYGVPKFSEGNKTVTSFPDLSNYEGYSIVEALEKAGYPSNFISRTDLWYKLGNTDKYTGSAEQNTYMIKLLKYGNKIPSLKGYKGFSIVDGLSKFGYNSSFTYRSKLWELIGEQSVYKGTSKQNTKLLNVLKYN